MTEMREPNGSENNSAALHLRMRRVHLPAWFTGWYMGRIAGRYCPCEWPVKLNPLMELCAWIDDEEERHDLIRFTAFHMKRPQTITTSSGTAGAIRFRFFRTRHNGSQVER